MPNRSHLLTPLAAALLMPLGATAMSPVLPLPGSLCGNEPMPPIEAPYRMVCALDHGVLVNSPIDQGDRIRAALDQLVSQETGLYFPQGRYVVGGNLPLRTGNVLVGSRFGITHFVNPSDRTTFVTQTFHSANKLLIDSLVFDNIAIHFFHRSGSVIRNNGFRQTASPEPQISVNGADRVEGNVLWREPGHPGAGIRVGLVASGHGGEGARVRGNLLGARDGRAGGTPAWAKEMAVLVTRDAAIPLATEPLGHFTAALDIRGTGATTVSKNVITVDAVPGAQRQTAALVNVNRMKFERNKLSVRGDAGSALPFTVQAPQDTLISGNTLQLVDLLLTPDPDGTRPLKRSDVSGNMAVGAAMDTRQPVTGDDETHTTIKDLSFSFNRFDSRDPTRCLIAAPLPSQPGRTFAAWGNVRVPGQQPARTCNLRDADPSEAKPVPVPLSPTDIVIPAAPRPPATPDGTGTAGETGGNASTLPAPPEQKKGWKRIKAGWKNWWDHTAKPWINKL